MSNFIRIYNNMLTPEFCEACIHKFESSQHQQPGSTGQGVDKIKKNSTDITINLFPDEWEQEILQLQQSVLQGLMHYVREHPFMLAGAIALQQQKPDGSVEQISYRDIESMDDQALAGLIQTVYRLGSINIQKYNKGEGGYFYWHSEHYPHPNDPHNDSLHRTLLWMFYLNDVAEGGETEFYFQQASCRPERGALVIAPAGFTHTHRGQMPQSNDKYIFTSWLLYQRAAELYGQPENT